MALTHTISVGCLSSHQFVGETKIQIYFSIKHFHHLPQENCCASSKFVKNVICLGGGVEDLVGHKSDHRECEETLGSSGRYYINDLVVFTHNGEQVPGMAELRLSFSQLAWQPLAGLNKHQVDHTAPHSITITLCTYCCSHWSIPSTIWSSCQTHT